MNRVNEVYGADDMYISFNQPINEIALFIDGEYIIYDGANNHVFETAKSVYDKCTKENIIKAYNSAMVNEGLEKSGWSSV